MQRKTTTTMERNTLKDLIKDVKILEGMIIYLENMTVISVFNVQILRQSSSGKHGLEETMFEWHINNKEKKTQAKSTVIILLSRTKASMQILTKSKLDYKGQGTVIAFPSYLHHKPIYLEQQNNKTMSLPERYIYHHQYRTRR